MFHPGHWAAAFINTVEREGGDIEDGIEFLKVLSSWVKKLPGETAGGTAALKMEKLVRAGIAKKGFSFSIGQETALCVFLLMVQKKTVRRVDSVIEKTKDLLDKKRGVMAAYVEYAFPPDEEAKSRIKEEIKKRCSAAGVELTERVNAGLIGGYRLRIGDEIIDSSVRSQLRRLSACLTRQPD